MTVGCEREFATVNALLATKFDTRGVDAFCLAWIKYERQLRKVAAFLVYQSSELGRSEKPALREVIRSKKTISHISLRGSISLLCGAKFSQLIGDDYASLSHSLSSSYNARQKIVHGQQTGLRLSRENLEEKVHHIQRWCMLFSDSSYDRFGYDGFGGKTSLFKSNNATLSKAIDEQLAIANGWAEFVRTRF
ncbi:hypothetical protein GF108_08930 [Phyllobacterium sp. SYP-B3895]|uniref:hypothetical protein n=1 Tax=Phyllobacterium sp. SYP-B3895 TaxID=2663240 RepID=UPI0012996E59|nr:hypothetical protein [Phyllobacterium sp. SYP-B3895]MRG55705.1 hypothetical protein [Phyllobacterium sp. SYP-B3895]